jgi:hypothetical protein
MPKPGRFTRAAYRARRRTGLARGSAGRLTFLVSEDADLTFLAVDVNANMIRGCPLLSEAVTASFVLVGRQVVMPPPQATAQPS